MLDYMIYIYKKPNRNITKKKKQKAIFKIAICTFYLSNLKLMSLVSVLVSTAKSESLC